MFDVRKGAVVQIIRHIDSFFLRVLNSAITQDCIKTREFIKM